MGSSPVVLVSANTMKLYSIGPKRINYRVLCVVMQKSSSGKVHTFKNHVISTVHKKFNIKA